MPRSNLKKTSSSNKRFSPNSNRHFSDFPNYLADQIEIFSKFLANKSLLSCGFLGLWLIIFLGWNTYLDKPVYVHKLENPAAPIQWQFPRIHKSFSRVDLRKISLLSQPQLIYFLKKAVPRRMRRRFSKVAYAALDSAQKYQVDPFWVISIMWAESHFKSSAASYVGAMGLMQIMPGTGVWLGEKLHREGLSDHLMGPHPKGVSYKYGGASEERVNIEMGVYYLGELLKMFNGSYRHATVAYNMGPAWVQRRIRRRLPVGRKNLYWDKVLKNHAKLIVPFMGKVKHLKIAGGPNYVTYNRNWKSLAHPIYYQWNTFLKRWLMPNTVPLKAKNSKRKS